MDNAQIFIVDDDFELCLDIQEYFEDEFVCDHAQTTETASQKLKINKYNLIILDIEIGKDNGIDYYHEVRKYHNGPIIFLSGINDVNLRLNSYEIGADDFLTKPFDLTELLYKVKKIVSGNMAFNQYYYVGEYKIDVEYQKVFYRGQELKLQLTPYKLFVYFLNNQDVELSREQIFNDVWEIKEIHAARLIDVNVCKLRKYVPGIRIKNVWGKGYIFTILKDKN